MNKVFFDTNLWIRYILIDNEAQFKIVRKLLELNEYGSIKIYSSSIIFLELAYVLQKVYKFQYQEILEVLNGIRSTKQLTIMNDTDLDLAIKYFKKYKLKFSDCLIASQISKGLTMLTFDSDFKKIKEINSLTPSEFLKSFKLN